MRRVLFRWLKQVTSAIFALVALYCCAEIGLRVYDSYCGQVTRRDVYDRGLICKSWDLHHELKPLQRITQLDPDTRQPLKLATNSFGLRGTEIQVPMPPGVYRIVCLGDERTFGTHVPDGETFCSQLQTLLQARSRVKIEVINAGVPDYCPLLSCLQFKHKLLGFQPDLVILNFDMSDVADDYRYRRLATMSDNQVPLACPNPGLVMPRSSKSKSKGTAPRDELSR